MDRMTLRASVTRHYGKITVSFGAEMSFDVIQDFTSRQGYAVLLDQINAQFDDYEAHVLPREQFDRAGHEPVTGVQYFAGVEVVKNQKGKDVTYAVRTQESKFAKFGAALYELIGSYPKLKALVDQNGAYRFKKPMKVKIDMSGNHPRVLEIEGAE